MAARMIHVGTTVTRPSMMAATTRLPQLVSGRPNCDTGCPYAEPGGIP
jgi:hypothetical protein